MTDSIAIFNDLIRDTALNNDTLSACIFKNPQLLSSKEITTIFDKIKMVKDSDQAYAMAVLKAVISMQGELADNPEQYPFGTGPLEALFMPVKDGAMAVEAACEKAVDQQTYASLSPVYVIGMMTAMESLVLDAPGEWPGCVNFCKILLASLEACPAELREQEYFLMWSVTVEAWVAIVTMALHDVPDGRLFTSALTCGSDLAAAKLASDKPGSAWRILHRTGILHLDPYFSGRSSSNYMVQFNSWQDRLVNHFGKNIIAKENDTIWMPAPEKALDQAAGLLEKAISISDGIARAKSCKALAETYNWKYQLTDVPVLDKIQLYAGQALALFVPDQNFIQERAVLLNLLNMLNLQVPASVAANKPDVSFLLNASVEDILVKYDVAIAFDLLNQTIHFYLSADPAVALSLWMKNDELVAGHYDEQFLKPHYTAGLQIIKKYLSGNWIESLPQNNTVTLLELANTAANAEQWSDVKLAAVYISIAYASTAKDEEGEGVIILAKVLDQLSAFTDLQKFADCLAWLSGDLHIGAAVNFLNRGNTKPALDQYAEALRTFIDLGMQDFVINVLNRIANLLNEGGEEVLIHTVVHVTGAALGLELVGGLRARDICQEIYRTAVMKLVSSGNRNAVLLLLLMQYGKGFGFAATLSSNYRSMIQQEPAAAALLNKITALTKKVNNENLSGLPAEAGYLDEEILLTSYTGDYGKRKGINDQEILENLKVTFDALLYKRLIQETGNLNNFFQTPEQIKASLNADTVLMVQYFGIAKAGEAAIYTIFITKEVIKLIMGVLAGWPSSNIEMADGDITVSIPLLGFLISDTRKAIQENPHGQTVIAEGRKRLGGDSSEYLGGDIKNILDDFAQQGKKHLCIVPHGGLHFYPYHLLPVNDGIVADKWAVTYLPNLKLLDARLHFRRPAATEGGNVLLGDTQIHGQDEAESSLNAVQEKQGTMLTAFGLSFSDNSLFPHLNALKNAVPEATNVAALFGIDAITDEKATKKAFWNAITSSTMVHIATHGEHKASAPVFQCIYVYPDEQCDGIIHAYELFGADLQGLDLVTLSACETALGRVDPADNLRGMPAAFLTAGVSTIIGTLWAATDSSCELFFTTLYSRLQAGDLKFQAFYAAQQATRAVFPEYRQWGAFYLMGKFQ